MGLDIHIKGERDKDEKYWAMKAIADNCRDFDIELPDEVFEYFGGYPHSVEGPRVDIGNAVRGHVMEEGKSVIYLDKIPESVKRIIVEASV